MWETNVEKSFRLEQMANSALSTPFKTSDKCEFGVSSFEISGFALVIKMVSATSYHIPTFSHVVRFDICAISFAF